ncbi:MAG: EmrB/QacA family drug resistance transporter [Alphaproteobacteria bacterium CG_4_10_14_0_2_um_filter_63_37]|nr:MAG: EmrB/QacA family drug resistance transporter [Alphaproteobacteria bacterium CG_4_10_14_0_2_um_filter_63_37]
MLATILVILDTTIVNVALPHMMGTLSATQDQIAWVLTSYIVASAVMIPPTGWMAMKIGRKRLFLIAVALFTLASVACGLATNLPEIVLFRIIQGIAGAPLVPLSQAILFDTYPKEKHGQAMAMFGVGVMVGPILGPTLGGYITEWLEWQWVFFINLPFGLLALFLIATFVPETPKGDRPFDRFGFLTLSLGIASLQLMLDRGQGHDWLSSNEILTEAILAGMGFYLFAVHSMTTRNPFISPVLFSDRNFLTGMTFMFIMGVVLLATMALLPPYLMNLMHYPVVDTGLVMVPRGLGSMFSMALVGRLVGKYDPRILIAIGFGFVSESLWEMSYFNLEIGMGPLIWTGVVQGLGLGFIFVPLQTIAFATLPPPLRTEAAGLFNLIRNIGSSIGISIIMVVFSRSVQINHAELGAFVTPFNPLAQAPLLPPPWGIDSPAGLAMIDLEINRQAAMIGYTNDFLLMGVLTVAVMPLLLLMKRPEGVGARRP